MSKFKSLMAGAALVGAVAFASTAMADGMPRRGSIKDAPYVAPFSWTGFYVGVNAGYAWGDSSTSSSFTCPSAGNCPWNLPANLAAFSAAGSGGLSPDGFTGGVQAGYNIQSGSLVYGVEIDFNALDVNQGRSVTAGVPSIPGSVFTSTTSVSTEWLMTLRGRLGFTLSPNTLVYVTGGLAMTELTVSNSFSDNALVPPTAGGSSTSDIKTGWTVGGGIEVALNRNWTLKGEYLYADFGSTNTFAAVNNVPNAGNVANVFGTSADLTTHIARVGVNYKF